MKAVVFSDNTAFATKVASTLARVGRQARVNVEWKAKLWPINALNESALADNALVEALDAHLILFSRHRARSLPGCVFDWLGRWAAGRTIQDAAVGVIEDEISARSPASSFPELSAFAREHGMSFIVNNEDRPARNSARLPVRVPHDRIVALQIAQINPSAPAGLAPRGSYRSFGINE